MSTGQLPKPILVTGAHRSGTTWVGKMLSAGPQTAYISEPLNVLHRRGVLNAPVKYWYTYLSSENETDFLDAFKDLLGLKYHLRAELAALRSRKDILRMGRDLSVFCLGRLRRARPLIKDPFAVFSMEWFAKRLECEVVVTVRHPAAFVSSLKRLNWSFDFSDLLAQPYLMLRWLESYREAMMNALQHPNDIVVQGALLWKMIYAAVEQESDLLTGLVIVKHEDLSREPRDGFRNLYQALGLSYTPQIERAVLQSSSAENPGELSPGKVHSVRLDSRQNIRNWQKRLTPAEVETIRRTTEEIAAFYYTDEDW